ncbi:hypothetical protein N7468_007952 [Penicillium chermesinum]|uniref:Uncharacterized protein n=1 Tax=Penicillium chermesinum TaxID=63820 RepID=A0A9W9NP03_9EURO|nr:uncharacterized protein N7468_007952 [Penicillium chermesinum]KAJ5223410.1 hypothetical protein N7468_007952 [Penicillium chermesinum]
MVGWGLVWVLSDLYDDKAVHRFSPARDSRLCIAHLIASLGLNNDHTAHKFPLVCITVFRITSSRSRVESPFGQWRSSSGGSSCASGMLFASTPDEIDYTHM